MLRVYRNVERCASPNNQCGTDDGARVPGTGFFTFFHEYRMLPRNLSSPQATILKPIGQLGVVWCLVSVCLVYHGRMGVVLSPWGMRRHVSSADNKVLWSRMDCHKCNIPFVDVGPRFPSPLMPTGSVHCQRVVILPTMVVDPRSSPETKGTDKQRDSTMMMLSIVGIIANGSTGRKPIASAAAANPSTHHVVEPKRSEIATKETTRAALQQISIQQQQQVSDNCTNMIMGVDTPTVSPPCPDPSINTAIGDLHNPWVSTQAENSIDKDNVKENISIGVEDCDLAVATVVLEDDHSPLPFAVQYDPDHKHRRFTAKRRTTTRWTFTFMLLVVTVGGVLATGIALLTTRPNKGIKDPLSSFEALQFYAILKDIVDDSSLEDPLSPHRRAWEWIFGGGDETLAPSTNNNIGRTWDATEPLLWQRFWAASLYFATTTITTGGGDQVSSWAWCAPPMPGDTDDCTLVRSIIMTYNDQDDETNSEGYIVSGFRWMSRSIHECDWMGVTCNIKSQIVALDLGTKLPRKIRN